MKPKPTKTDENDFAALDRLARSIDDASLKPLPLTPELRRRWEAARRTKPKHGSAAKAVPTLITLEPRLLRRLDAYAKKAGLSRSQLISDAIEQRMAI